MSDEFQPKVVTGHFQRTPSEWRIDQIINRIAESGEGVVSIACLDIDGFSQVEDTHGYELADALLERIAGHLRGVEGPEFAARYVRDSFLVVYTNYTLEEAFLATEALRKALDDQTFTVAGPEAESVGIDVQFSAGVSTYPGDPEDRYELISLAEEGARRAYEAGGSRTVFGRADSMTPKTSHYNPAQLDQLKELRKRLDRSDASLLREALDDLLRKYDQRDQRRWLARMFGWGSEPRSSQEGRLNDK
jgi:diguanylate cyclase (GGDEF)-like protein